MTLKQEGIGGGNASGLGAGASEMRTRAGSSMATGDAVLGGEGAINRFRRRGDTDAMDEAGGNYCFSGISIRVGGG
jgi:hypothetical protein